MKAAIFMVAFIVTFIILRPKFFYTMRRTILLSALLLLFALHSSAQTVEVTTHHADTVPTTIQKILITSFGTTRVRHTMDKISPRMVAHYQLARIEGAYAFLGSDAGKRDNNFRSALQQHHPDAVLFLFEPPIGPDTLTVHSRGESVKLFGSSPQQQVVRMLKTKIEISLRGVLWIPTTNKVIWRGETLISGWATEEALYQKISDQLTDELWRKNLLIRREP